jgi:hypothetical protein
MKEDNAVSLWLGMATNEDALREYVTARYSEDGDYLAPQFCDDFGIRSFDEDFIELRYHAIPLTPIDDLLRGCSYHDNLVPKFSELAGDGLRGPVNSVALLYNFRYDGHVQEVADGNVRLRYIGTAKITR